MENTEKEKSCVENQNFRLNYFRFIFCSAFFVISVVKLLLI